MEGMEGGVGLCVEWESTREKQNLLRLDSQREPAIDATGEPYGEDSWVFNERRERDSGRESGRMKDRETELRPSPP